MLRGVTSYWRGSLPTPIPQVQKIFDDQFEVLGKDMTPLYWVVSGISTWVLFCRSAGECRRGNSCQGHN